MLILILTQLLKFNATKLFTTCACFITLAISAFWYALTLILQIHGGILILEKHIRILPANGKYRFHLLLLSDLDLMSNKRSILRIGFAYDRLSGGFICVLLGVSSKVFIATVM